MKVTEAKFTRRYNVGQYEHEEYSLTATLEDEDKTCEVLASLKADVKAAYAGEAAGVAEDAETEETESTSGKGKGKSPRKPKRGKGKSSGDSSSEEEAGEESTEDDSSASDLDDTEDQTSEEEEGNDEAEVEEENEEEVEDPPPKKGKKAPAAKPSTTKSPGKFKKKGSPYSRSNETHKKLFSEKMHSLSPGWNNNAKKKAKVKQISVDLDGQEFLDANGEILPSFIALMKKGMK